MNIPNLIVAIYPIFWSRIESLFVWDYIVFRIFGVLKIHVFWNMNSRYQLGYSHVKFSGVKELKQAPIFQEKLCLEEEQPVCFQGVRLPALCQVNSDQRLYQCGSRVGLQKGQKRENCDFGKASKI